MEDPRIISALFIFLKMSYYNVLINTHITKCSEGKIQGEKRNFLFFCTKKYPYDFKIEIIGVFSPTYSVGCFTFCFTHVITVFFSSTSWNFINAFAS